MQFNYEDLNALATIRSKTKDENKESEVKEVSPEEWSTMSAREKKLFQLRMKQNKARVENKRAVEEEDRRKKEDPSAAKKRQREDWEKEKEKEKETLVAEGLDPDRESILSTPATVAERFNQKKKDSSVAFGWDQYNPEAQYNAYKKRLKDLNFSMDEYQKQKEVLPAEDFYKTATDANYGKTPDIPKENVDKMVHELEKRIEKRQQFSRRRHHNDEAYVDYINDRNKVFNKKVSRAFDKYQHIQEIKQNLERGTAL